jgi:hypothetical protein
MNALIVLFLAALVLALAYCFVVVIGWVISLLDPKRRREDARAIQAAHEAAETCIRMDQIRRGR